MDLVPELRHGGEVAAQRRGPTAGRPRRGRRTGSGQRRYGALPRRSESQVTMPNDLGLVVAARRLGVRVLTSCA
jgi:hypothetical protein